MACTGKVKAGARGTQAMKIRGVEHARIGNSETHALATQLGGSTLLLCPVVGKSVSNFLSDRHRKIRLSSPILKQDGCGHSGSRRLNNPNIP